MNPNPPTWYDWFISIRDNVAFVLTFLGLLLTIVGFWIAFVQLRRVKRAAEAAKDAADATRNAMRERLTLVETSKCVQITEEVKSFIRTARYDAALMRVSDLIGDVIQLNHANPSFPKKRKQKFTAMLSQLSIMRSELESKVMDHSHEIEPNAVLGQLGEISDEFHIIIGESRTQLEEGTENG